MCLKRTGAKPSGITRSGCAANSKRQLVHGRLPCGRWRPLATIPSTRRAHRCRADSRCHLAYAGVDRGARRNALHRGHRDARRYGSAPGCLRRIRSERGGSGRARWDAAGVAGAAAGAPAAAPRVWTRIDDRFLRANLEPAVSSLFLRRGAWRGREAGRDVRAALRRARRGQLYSPFRPLTASEDEEIVSRINASGADIVWVGLSTPKQERWMFEHKSKLNAPVLVGVGAAFDFHTGRVAQAPQWMRENGLEWFFRLTQDPLRLWRRYLLGGARFTALVALEMLGLKTFREAAPAPSEAAHEHL